MRGRRARRLALGAVVSAAAATMPLMVGAGIASAAPKCDVATFTRNGVFDTQGYLACLGGSLPATGSDSLRTVAVGAGLLVVGSGAVLASTRRRRLTLE